PAALIAGPLYSNWICKRIPVPPIPSAATTTAPASRPGFGITVFTVALPVLLMLLSTAADLALPKANSLRQAANFIGHPLCALTASVILSLFTFGFSRGFNRQQILKFSDDCLGPTASVLLVVGAGGGFNKILVA